MDQYVDLEANLIPNKSFSRWQRFPLFGFITAGGEVELETTFDGTNKFEVECHGLDLDPGTELRVLINKIVVLTAPTMDGKTLSVRRFARDGDELPQMKVGDLVTIMGYGETLFTGVVRPD